MVGSSRDAAAYSCPERAAWSLIDEVTGRSGLMRFPSRPLGPSGKSDVAALDDPRAGFGRVEPFAGSPEGSATAAWLALRRASKNAPAEALQREFLLVASPEIAVGESKLRRLHVEHSGQDKSSCRVHVGTGGSSIPDCGHFIAVCGKDANPSSSGMNALADKRSETIRP